MGFCYPGRGHGGDLPPRPECAPLWRDAFLKRLKQVRLTLVIGAHAQRWHDVSPAGSVAGAAKRWLQTPGPVVPLAHPSPRNNVWLSQNRWFEDELIPLLRERVARTLSPDGQGRS